MRIVQVLGVGMLLLIFISMCSAQGEGEWHPLSSEFTEGCNQIVLTYKGDRATVRMTCYGVDKHIIIERRCDFTSGCNLFWSNSAQDETLKPEK